MSNASPATGGEEGAAILGANEVFLCRASGEGSHDFRVCTDEAGVMVFYKEMFGCDSDGKLDSALEHFRDEDNWSNEVTAYECELYCATFEVWKVDRRDIAFAASEIAGKSELEAMAAQLEMAYGDLPRDIPPGPPTSIVKRLREIASTQSAIAPKKDWGRAQVGMDGNCGYALLGEDLQSGEAEFVEVEGWPSPSYRQEREAWGKALKKLEDRLGSGLLRYEVIR